MNTERKAVLCLALSQVLILAGCTGGDDAGTNDAGGSAPSHEMEGHREEHGGDGSRAGEVKLTKSQLSRLNLELSTAEGGSASTTIEAPATVRFDASRVAKIGPRLSAKVVEVVADLGDRVQAGDPVVVMESVALGKAKALHITTKARLQTARAEFEREKSLAEQGISSQAELLESEARFAEAQAEHDAADEELRLYGLTPDEIDAVRPDEAQPLSRYTLTSPVEGYVQRRNLVVGETVSPDETPIHVVDTSRMWVMIDAYERDLASLETGLPVQLTVRPLPGHRFEGRTDWVSRELDEKSRTVRVRASMDNSDGFLRAGMFGKARITAASDRAESPMVPVDSVQELQGRDVVFVPGDEKGSFRALEVSLGNEAGGLVEIRSGLQIGDQVVVSGSFDLKSALTASERSAAHSH